MAIRESLLDVTARLYAEHGWLGTTTRRIAEAAGVNEVTLFRQFGSKESLLVEAIQHAAGDHAVARLPEMPVRMAHELAAWGVIHHRSIREMSGIIRSCLAEWEQRPALAPKVCNGGLLAVADVIRYLGIARQRRMIAPAGSIEAAAVMLVHAIFMDAMTRNIMPATRLGSAEETISSFVSLLLRGLGVAEAA